MDFKHNIRPANPADAEEIIAMMKEHAERNGLHQQFKLSPEQLRKDGFGNDPVFQCIVAEAEPAAATKSGIVGYALFYYIYSTFKGKNIYLQDLFVKEAFGKSDVAEDLVKTVAKIAIDNGCKQYRSACLGKNTEDLNFLKNLGARDLTEVEDWHLMAFDTQAMCAFASKLGKR